jgi:hypothetical protein
LSFAIICGQRHAVDRAVRQHGHHVVAVAAEHHGPDVLDAETPSLAREEQREARAVEHAGHAHHLLGGKARATLKLVDHRVERVRDHDHECVGAVLLGVVGDVANDREVDADEVVAALAGLAGMPAVMIITSAPAQSSHFAVPVMRRRRRSWRELCSRSSALPLAKLSFAGMSKSTTSPSCFRHRTGWRARRRCCLRR